MTTLTIVGIPFASSTEAKEHCSRILNDGPIGSRVTGADAEFVEQLLLNRPDKLEQIGDRKVVGFERRYREGKENWTRCFWAILDDGTALDFSFYKAIDSIVASQRAKKSA